MADVGEHGRGGRKEQIRWGKIDGCARLILAAINTIKYHLVTFNFYQCSCFIVCTIIL